MWYNKYMSENKLNCIVCDIDGCIFDSRNILKYIPEDKNSRIGWDNFNLHLYEIKPNNNLINIIKLLSVTYPIIFLTSREHVVNKNINTYNITIDTLNKAFNGFAPINYPHKLIMRKYDDYRDSHIVKEELLIKHILPEYNPLIAIDDCEKNIAMFSSYGIDTIHYNINSKISNFLSLTKRIDINA
jgi:hypothetical protein